MMRDLTQTADRSCWISGDRVNACIGSGTNGVIEFGFHGLQPVSRNSRLLVRPEGVLTFALRETDGRETPVAFGTVDVQPHAVTRKDVLPHGPMECEAVAADRAVHVFVRGELPGAELIVRFSSEAFFADVRGERMWDAPRVQGPWLTLCCRDLLELDSWMKRTGPYAGDFLLPEHWRRRIFRRPIRSGLATIDDLLPEYRDAKTPIYDARTWIVMGGNRATVSVDGPIITFVVPVPSSDESMPLFSIAGSETDPAGNEEVVTSAEPLGYARERIASAQMVAPQLSCVPLPQLSSFVGTVPGSVQSCTVRELGMARATPGAYYWLWAWDTMVTGQECLRWGAHDLAGSMVRYVHTHRDIDGRIPARWTRSHEPMDTPPHGALEFLLLHLAYEQALASGEKANLSSVYPHAVAHLRQSMAAAPNGLVPNLSFYPDRPLAFGRTEQSVVALETACLYSFARLMDNVAGMIGDGRVRQDACRFADTIAKVFAGKFWDAERGFFVDSYDSVTGQRNVTYPLFSLLFLQHAPGIRLVREFVPAMGRFMVENFQTSMGVRMLPARDSREAGEDALGSWYPHWDIYLLKVLRRAGDTEAIVRWAHAAERVLERLGYAPEFIALDGLTPEPGPAWLKHGAVSNLNCITGWHRAAVEGLCGIELDPGGMSIVPLGLPIGPTTLRGYNVRGTTWDVTIDHGGPHLQEVRVDGRLLEGCLKVPAAYQDRGHHEISVQYGASPRPIPVRELLNAELLESRMEGRETFIRFRALGMTDILIDAPGAVRCLIDGATSVPVADPATGQGSLLIEDPGVHECEIALLS